MRVTFEEKTYESYFNNELDKRSKIYFPLGQVQEGYLGFDSSAFSKSKKLWEWLGYPGVVSLPFKGSYLREIADEMEIFLKVNIGNIPTMKVNLLFQYKKPEYITTSLGTEWDKWGQPYYRYHIYQEQQELLMQIHKKLGHEVLIIYASPALPNVDELVNAHINNEILELSNFRKASELHSHHRNTYITAGTYSIACSEQEQIENFDLIELLNEISKTNNGDKKGNNIDFIQNFSNNIVDLTNENENLYFSKSFKKLNETITEFEDYELLYSFLVMRNFRLLTGTQWLVKLAQDFQKDPDIQLQKTEELILK